MIDYDQEEYCSVCHRPSSQAGKMIHLPGNLTVCADCMQKSFDAMEKMGFPMDPNILKNMSPEQWQNPMGFVPPNPKPEAQDEIINSVEHEGEEALEELSQGTEHPAESPVHMEEDPVDPGQDPGHPESPDQGRPKPGDPNQNNPFGGFP